MKPYRYLALFAMLVVTSLPGHARAEDEITIEPWHNAFAQARYLIERGRMGDARERLEEIVDEYEFPEVHDRASSMYSETYLRERRYSEAIDFMEDALEARGDEPFEQTRRLYTATERRIRRARNRAREAVEALEDRYEDISWFNVVKLFDQLGRRKDLKEAEKDLDELEDLHRSFDPRHLFPVPALTVAPEEDGVTDAESTEEATDESADTTQATPTEEDEETDESEKSDVEEAEATTEADAVAETDAEAETVESTSEESADEETGAPAASTDAEAEAETEAAAASETEAEAPTEEPGAEVAGDTEAMNRDTARELLAEEISALVALIPEDKLAEADAILGGTTASEEGDEAGGAEVETEEVDTDSAAASDETSGSADADEATEEPGDESSAAPTEGTLELMPSSPESAETSATAEVAAAEDTADTTAADVTTLGSAREQYYAAYQRLQQALVSGDQEAIATARQEYLTSVQVMQGSQATAAGGSTAEAEGPAAPTSSTTGPAETDGGAAASTDAEATGPGAPGATAAPAGTGVNPTNGFIRRDRAGIQRGVSDGGLRTSRGSLRR